MGDRRRLGAALALIAGFMGFELVVGIAADSLAVLADAAHMLGDAAALALALAAAWIAGRPASPEDVRLDAGGDPRGARERACCSSRSRSGSSSLRSTASETPAILSAAGSSPRAWWASLSISWRRPFVAGSLNLRAANRHVLADLLGSIGVVVAGDRPRDRLGLRGPARLARDRGARARQLVVGPPRLDHDPARERTARHGRGEIGSAMVGVPGVQEVHDLHVWTITSGFPSLSAHVLVPEGDDCHAVRRRLEAMLSEFGLTHDAAGRARRRARPSRLDRARDAPRDAASLARPATTATRILRDGARREIGDRHRRLEWDRRAIVAALRSEGVRVVGGSRRADLIDADIGLELDVTDAASCERFVTEAVTALEGGLDVLVNGAGLALGATRSTTPPRTTSAWSSRPTSTG